MRYILVESTLESNFPCRDCCFIDENKGCNLPRWLSNGIENCWNSPKKVYKKIHIILNINIKIL